MSEPDQTKPPRDPLLVSSLRELKVFLATWAVACLWTVGYCGRAAYKVDPDAMEIVFGMPAWVFWGIGLPWVLVSGFSIWFALCRMEDHPLEPGEETDERHD